MSQVGQQVSRTLRERILALEDVQMELVEVPEWGESVPGGKLEVRSMTGKQRAAMLQHFIGGDGEMDVEALYPSLIIASVFDPDSGELIFSQEDHDALNTKNSAVLERLAQAAMRLSGISQGEQDEMGKGSSPTPSGASTST